jgi:hypothetical protein
LALVRCNCSNKLTMLMKLAMENTDIEREVSFRIANRGCVIWYKNVKVCSGLDVGYSVRGKLELTVAMLIQAGSNRRGSSEPPER